MEIIRYRIQLIHLLFKYTKNKYHILAIIMLSGIAVGMQFIQPLCYKVFITDIILERKVRYIWGVAAGYLGIQITLWIVNYLRNRYKYYIRKSAMCDMKCKIMDKYFQIEFNQYKKIDTGRLKMVLDENMEALYQFYEAQGADFFVRSAECIIIIVILFFLNWKLAVLAMVLLPWTFSIDILISKREQIYSKGMIDNHASCANWLNKFIKNWKEYRAFGLESSNNAEFEKFVYNDMKYFCPWMKFWVTRFCILPKIRNEFLLQFALYFLGGVLIFWGEISIGRLLVFAQYYSLLMESIQFLSVCRGDLVGKKKVFDMVVDELQRSGETVPKQSYLPGDIELENISFKYPEGETQVINQFNCLIKQGERVGIIGESGRGKSTLIKIMTGILQPDEGDIRIGGIDIQNISSSDLFRKIGMISQEEKLFNTSIVQNLRYGKKDATLEEMKTACQKAQIDNYIESLPQKYDSVIGDNGIKLSGGQKQRLVLARLFLSNADIYIFDEATSALDQQTEDAVQNVISSIGSEKTIIVVAHRKSSLEVCERMIEI